MKSVAAAGTLTGLAGCTSNIRGSGGPLKVGFSTHFTSGAWVTALVEGTKFYAQDQGFEFKLFKNNLKLSNQIEHINQMVNQGYDGMVVVPVNTEGVASAIEKATNNGVPVFTNDIDAATDAVKMNVSWSDKEASIHAANLLVQYLRDQQPNKDSYQVLEVRAPPGRDISRLRHEPFVNKIRNTQDVEVVGTIVGDWVPSTAKKRTKEWINANSPPDGLYAANFGMGLGAQSALKSMGLQYKSSHDKHISHVQLDGSSTTHEMIKQGYIDAAVDQPNYFYGPIALKYLEKYVKGDGEEALPSIGADIKKSELTIEPAEHKGTTLWQEPIWAPAHIGKSFGHRRFVTSKITITEENADAPYLWGNIWG